MGWPWGLNEAAGYLAVASPPTSPASSPPGPGCGPSRSTSAWPTPASGWGLLPLLFVRGGLAVGQAGLLIALNPAVRGLGQLLTGPLSDRLGRKPLITAGMLLQALALAGTALAGSFLPWAATAVLLGVGTAMVYPTLLAAIGDVAHPSWRAAAVGIYRLWRDAGFAVGALLAGLVADLAGLVAAVWVVAARLPVPGRADRGPSRASVRTGRRDLLRPVRTRRSRPRGDLRAALCLAGRPPPASGGAAGRPGAGR